MVFLYPALSPGRALLPGGYLHGMYPWKSPEATAGVLPWNPLLWDGIAQFYPWRAYLSQTVNDTETIPLWNPHQFCGTPFLANAQTGVFYPLNLLFIIFSPVRAFGLSALLHLFLAGVFTFLLVRALGIGRFGATVAAITFPFTAFMVLWLELPTLVNVATWLPMVLYLILRSWDRTGALGAIYAGLALGVAILAGHIQIASYVAMAAALWWIWLAVSRVHVDGWGAILRGFLLGTLSFVVAFLISAPQILPTLELASLSHRVRQVTSEGFASYLAGAIPARQLITLFVPNFYGSPATAVSGLGYIGRMPADYIEYGLYVGVMPLVLAIFGALFALRWRGVGFFITLGLLSFLLAFGTPVNWIFYHLVPGTASLGGPNRTIVLFCFSISMLAGFGGHWFIQMAQEEYRATNRKLGWRALAVGGAAFAALFIAAQSIATMSLGPDASAVARLATGQYTVFGTMVVASLGILALYTANQLPKPFFFFLTVAVIVADLFSFGMGFNPNCDVSEVYPETPLTKWIAANAPQTRLMPINPRWSLYDNPGAVLPPNAATVFGFYDVQGYDSLFSRTYKEFVDRQLGVDSSPQENGNMLLVRRFVPDWPVGTAGLALSSDPISAEGVKETTELDHVHVYDLTGGNGYQPVYLTPSEGSRAWIGSRTANSVTVVAETSHPAELVLAEANYPGWRAEIEGEATPIGVQDGIFRAVRLEPGSQSVTFRFEPGSYVLGLFLGLIGLGIVGTAIGASTNFGREQ